MTLVEKKTVCNFLIHPGLRTHEHDTIEHKVGLLLLKIKQDLELNAGIVIDELRDAWTDLQSTKTDLLDFTTLESELAGLLDQINVIVINSESSATSSYINGLNIVIGGNSLGRGLTLPGLHTVYYCRTAQTPQADTCWQHSRIFGYDRDRDLCRIFLPPVLLRLFRELDEANDAVTGLIVNGGDLENYSILSPRGTRPTRPSVIEIGAFDIWYGGTNYFPDYPLSANMEELDKLLGDGNTIREVSLDLAAQIVSLIEVEDGESWIPEQVNTHITTLKESGYDSGCQLVIRVNRDVGKGTGTLLSPDDRALTHKPQNRDRLVLIMYRLNGTSDKGWDDTPLWVPNIKFPVGANYIYTL